MGFIQRYYVDECSINKHGGDNRFKSHTKIAREGRWDPSNGNEVGGLGCEEAVGRGVSKTEDTKRGFIRENMNNGWY